MLTYRLLGGLEVARDDDPIDIGGPKQRAVLGTLLLDAGRVVSTDSLIRSVWGEQPTAGATGTLQVYISNLRRALRGEQTAPSPISRRAPGYSIDVVPDALDTLRFVALTDETQRALDGRDWRRVVSSAHEALDLWGGPLLADFADEPWVGAAAVGYDQRHVTCQQNLVTGLLAMGHLNPAVTLAQRLFTTGPLSEQAAWLFMLALHRSGRTAEALDVHRTYSRTLSQELGLDVGPALRELQGAILRRDAELDAWPAAVVTDPHPIEPARPESRRRHRPAMIGRATEFATVREVLQDRQGGLRWAIVSGEAGIGKTRLAEEALLEWQSDGGTVIRAGCPEDPTPPWWPVAELLRQLDVPESLFSSPTDKDVDAARHVVYERALAVLRRPENARLLLFVDDVQWADDTSLRFFTYLAETQPRLELAVLMTARQGNDVFCTMRLRAAVARLASSRLLELPPLSVEDVATLAEQVSGRRLDHVDAVDLARRTAGNPFFVSEYARLTAKAREQGQVPLAVRSVLGRRLARLTPDVVDLLRIAAVSGDRLDIDVLAAVSGLGRVDLADLLDQAADEHIIVPAPQADVYVFAHALLRDEILAQLTPTSRQKLHLRIAAAIAVDGGSSSQLFARASHLVEALPLSDPAEALEACRTAAGDAEQRGEWDAAARWWHTAQRPFDVVSPSRRGRREDLVIAEAGALARAGRGVSVLHLVEKALLDEVRAGHLSAAGRLAIVPIRSSGAWPWVYKGDPGPLVHQLHDIEPQMHADPVAHVRVLSSLACGMTYDPEGVAPDRLSRQARAIADETGNDDARADALLGRALTFAGIATRARESIGILGELAALPHEFGPVDDVLSHSLLVMAHLTLGQVDDAGEHLRLGTSGADALHLPVARTQFRWAEATMSLWRGDLTRAETVMTHAEQLHRETELYVAGVFDVARTCLHWAAGTLASATALDPDPEHVPWAAAVVAAARDLPGYDDALASQALADEPDQWLTHGSLTAVAHAVCDRGLVHLARPLIDRLLPFANMIAIIGQVGVVGPVDLALGRLYLLVQDFDAADEHQSAARALGERTGSPGAELAARVLAAQVSVARRRPVDIASLTGVGRRAARLGLTGVERDARSLLAANEV